MEERLAKHIESLERALAIPFRRRPLLLAAMAHPSYRNENPGLELENFERLEFFGDSILNFVICEKIYQLFPQADEGTLSQLRSSLVSRKILLRIARNLKLLPFVLLGKSELSRPHEEKSKILADCLESLIAAIYMDHGLSKARSFIEKNFRPYFNPRTLHRITGSAKTALQEYSQKNFKILPTYSATQKEPNRFLATVQVDKKGRAHGEGRTKKEAEENAARKLLAHLHRKGGRPPGKEGDIPGQGGHRRKHQEFF